MKACQSIHIIHFLQEFKDCCVFPPFAKQTLRSKSATKNRQGKMPPSRNPLSLKHVFQAMIVLVK